MDQSELKSCFSGHTLKETDKNLLVSPRECDGKKLLEVATIVDF